jgi:hypothetical protein
MKRTIGTMLVFIGLVLLLLGVFGFLAIPTIRLSAQAAEYLQYIPSFSSKLKEGELICAWTGPEDGQTWDGFVFIDRTNIYLRVDVETWDGRILKSSIISPSQKVWDFRELQLKMPSYPAFFGVDIKFSVGQPTSESDLRFSECFGVWIGLDGNYEYPLDYSGFHIKVWGISFVDNNLAIDIEFYPLVPDIGKHEVYAMNLTFKDWTYSNMPIKIADLEAGRRSYMLHLTDLTHVRFDVYGFRLYVPKQQFGMTSQPPMEPPPDENPPNENPPEYPPINGHVSVLDLSAYWLVAIVAGTSLMVTGMMLSIKKEV